MKSSLLALLTLLTALLLAPVASAQAPGLGPPSGAPPVAAGRVLLAPLQSLDPATNEPAARLTAVLLEHMGPRYPIVTIDQVPPWSDYSALIYLLGCPPGQYAGCALVCGDRVGAQWTVGGTVQPIEGGVNVRLSFVENRLAREVIAFGVALSGGDDAELTRAVDVFLGQMIAGAFREIDIRRLQADPAEQARLDAARNAAVAESLRQLEQERGGVQRRRAQVAERERLEKEALVEKYRGREELTPWQKVGLSEGAYVRYRNSGLPLGEWRSLAQGRRAEVLLRVAVGAGSGPFGQTFDGRYALDDQLDRVELQQFQFVSGASHAHVDLEAGVGLAPWLEVAGHVTFRNSHFRWLIHQDRVGESRVVRAPRQSPLAGWQAGGRVAIAPFPVQPVRPTAWVGLSFWRGTTWDALIEPVDDLEPMLPMSQVLLQVGPGVELRAARRFDLFARILGDFALGGQRVEVVQRGGPDLLVTPADISAFNNTSWGITLQAGLQLRTRLVQDRAPDTGPQQRFDEEGL